MTPQELKNKISETTWLLFTHPEEQREIANEIWIKFGADGIYVFINLQQQTPDSFEVQYLVGKGDSLNCSDYKKDNELVQYLTKYDVLGILEKSKNYQGNKEATIEFIISLFDRIDSPVIY